MQNVWMLTTFGRDYFALTKDAPTPTRLRGALEVYGTRKAEALKSARADAKRRGRPLAVENLRTGRYELP